MPKGEFQLHTVICSTRPGRIGPEIAAWFHKYATDVHGQFACTLIDLADFNLPVYDEPNHPVLRQYTKEHTKRWAATVNAADAYAFVTPEFNFGPPPSFVNALNYVYKEWNYKACGFVSYGGVSGGLRAVQLEKQLVTTLKMMPMVEGVPIPMVTGLMTGPNSSFAPNDLILKSAKSMLDELYRWTEALRPLRQRVMAAAA